MRIEPTTVVSNPNFVPLRHDCLKYSVVIIKIMTTHPGSSWCSGITSGCKRLLWVPSLLKKLVLYSFPLWQEKTRRWVSPPQHRTSLIQGQGIKKNNRICTHRHCDAMLASIKYITIVFQSILFHIIYVNVILKSAL